MPRDPKAPRQFTPAIGFAVKLNDVGRFLVGHLVVQQQPHRGRRSAEDRELHTAFLQRCTERRLIGELNVSGRLSHKHVVRVSCNPF